MATSRTNSESQDGSAELRNQVLRSSRQVSSSENQDGVELRKHVSRLVSESESNRNSINQEYRGENGENGESQVMMRGVSVISQAGNSPRATSELRNQVFRSSRHVSTSENQDGVELRNHRFYVSRLASESESNRNSINQEYRGDNSANGDGQVSMRSVSFISQAENSPRSAFELRNQVLRSSRQVSTSENQDGVELRNQRFHVSRSVSESESNRNGVNQEFRGENGANGDSQVLMRGVSVISKAGNSPRPDSIRANIGKKNGNMVLQLVLPSNNPDNNNYLTNTSIDEILGGNHTKRRSIGSQQDVYSTIGTECYVNQAYTNDLSDYGRKFAAESPHTPASLPSISDHAKSTNPEDKKANFRKHITNILSSMYALFVVTLGLVVYISDIFVGNSTLAETFSLYLVIIALVFILYLTVDVRLYMNKKIMYNNLLEKNIAEEIEMQEAPSGDYHLNIKLPEAARITKQLEHHYCYSKDRHSANFYLKIGAAGFCLGHLIHSGLLLGYQILFLTEDGENFYECGTVTSLILDIVYPIYSFFLLYFIFKYSNIIINRHASIVRFGLMHCISSNLCFWMWTILREILESLSNHDLEQEDEKEKLVEERQEDTRTGMSEVAFFSGEPLALPLTSYNKRGAKLLKAYLNSSMRMFIGECQSDAGLSKIYRNYSPYLYPFSVEYSILVVGVLFVIWQSIGKCKEKEEMSPTRQCDSPEGNGDNLESNVVIHADCHSANRGLFSGIVIMVLAVVSIILFFIAITDEHGRYEFEAILINMATTIIIIFLMMITCLFAYRQITKLDVNKEHVSLLDDLLLFICIPAFFLNGIVSIIPAINTRHAISIISVVLEVVQVLVQTPLIIDGLRRCSNSRELRREKPGRELLTFLIVCNVAMWITQTFEVKSHGLQDHRYEFYGATLWTIIGHMCIPLMMFYRFHSSVCITDIWKYAYEPTKH